MLISGGNPGESEENVEVLVPSTGYQCQMRKVCCILTILNNFCRNLPDRRYGHSQTGLTLCGGGRGEESRGSCLRWEGGGWVTSHHLNYSRIYHATWGSPIGILLIGSNTAELLHTNGTTSVLFYLQIDFRQIFGDQCQFSVQSTLFKFWLFDRGW